MSYHKYKDCIDACSAAAIACAHCESSCLDEDKVDHLTSCIKAAHECAAICILAMNALASGSPFAGMICTLCAEICIHCEKQCEKHHHMEHCKECAEACRLCAEACLSLGKS